MTKVNTINTDVTTIKSTNLPNIQALTSTIQNTQTLINNFNNSTQTFNNNLTNGSQISQTLINNINTSISNLNANLPNISTYTNQINTLNSELASLKNGINYNNILAIIKNIILNHRNFSCQTLHLNNTYKIHFCKGKNNGCGVGGGWGSNPYTSDTSYCGAGLHSGYIGLGGGCALLTLTPGHSSYMGSEKNGVSTSSYGSYGQSITYIS